MNNAPQKPKKKKSGCLIAVIVVVLLCAIVGGGDTENVETAESTEPTIQTETTESESIENPPVETVETEAAAEEISISGVIIECENSWNLWTGRNFKAYVDDGERVWYVTCSGKLADEVKVNDALDCLGTLSGETTYTRGAENLTVSCLEITDLTLYPAPEPETEAPKEETKAKEPIVVVEEKPTEYKAGQYKIGKDMPAGVYMLIQQDYSWTSYFAITSDANGKDILKNDNFENSSIIEVVDGEYLEINRCSAFPIDEADVVGIMDGYYHAGAYIVGRHIPAGEYKVEADPGEMAYICIYPDTRRSKIESNDNFEGSRYVELKNGQLFEIKRGRIFVGE